MTTPRVDSYTAVHKALRFAMYRTGALLEQTNFANTEERAAARLSVTTTLGFFDEHLDHEDGAIMPIFAAHAPELLARLEPQHREHEAVSAKLRILLDDLENSESNGRVPLGVEVCRTFNQMVAEQSAHMNCEETEGNAVLWAAFDDAGLVQLRTQVQAKIPPARFVEWLRLMLPRMNHQELLGMLMGIRASAPPEVYARVKGLAEELLGTRFAPIAAELDAA